jgi:hypothetical protein
VPFWEVAFGVGKGPLSPLLVLQHPVPFTTLSTIFSASSHSYHMLRA